MEWQTSVCLLQTEMENGSLFSLVGKQKPVIDDGCFRKRPNLLLHYCTVACLAQLQYIHTLPTGSFLLLLLAHLIDRIFHESQLYLRVNVCTVACS
jgi:hypothetical protein